LKRLGIGSRVELISFASLALLAAISPLGREATHPVVLGLCRSLLFTIILAALIETTKTGFRISPYLAGACGAILALMFASVALRPGSKFEGEYFFYQNALLLIAFLFLAYLRGSRSRNWKTAMLVWIVLVDLVYVAAAMAMGVRPLQGTF